MQILRKTTCAKLTNPCVHTFQSVKVGGQFPVVKSSPLEAEGSQTQGH